MTEEFDYGNVLPNGQYENYPVNTESVYKAPLRNEYMHVKCGATTRINDPLIVETYAKKPGFYNATWCIHCKDHLPLSEFVWLEKGDVTSIRLNQVKGRPGEDLQNHNKYGK